MMSLLKIKYKNSRNIREDFELYEIGGKTMSAKVVFAAAIGYLKDHLVGEIKHRKLGAVEDMMYWVVSVPAIWNDSCKQFMRESAEVVLFYIILIFFKKP